MKYQLTETNHQGHIFYGIHFICGDREGRIDDISTDKAAVENLCESLEKGEVTETTLLDIIYDFME